MYFNIESVHGRTATRYTFLNKLHNNLHNRSGDKKVLLETQQSFFSRDSVFLFKRTMQEKNLTSSRQIRPNSLFLNRTMYDTQRYFPQKLVYLCSYINSWQRLQLNSTPPPDKFEHWVFPPANILIHCKGKIWTGTMSPWTVETHVHIKHSVSSV